MFYAYVIQNNKNDKTYVGHSINLEERLKRHNDNLKNKSKSYTYKNKSDGKWELIHKEEFHNRKEAVKREKELKSYQGRLFIKKLIKK